MQEGAPRIHDEPDAEGIQYASRNLAAEILAEAGSVDAGFAAAQHVFQNTYRVGYVQQSSIEPHVTITWLDEDHRLVVRTATQVPFHVRRIIAPLLGIPIRRIRVIKPRIGGGFGGKQEILIEDLCGLLTLKTGRPVRLEYTREEELKAARARHPQILTVKTGVKDGRFTAISLEVLENSGAYGSHALTVMSVTGNRGLSLYRWHLGLNWVDGKPGTEKEVPLGARLTDGPTALRFDYFCGFTHARNIGTVIEQDRVVAHVKPVENQPLLLQKALAYVDQQAASGQPFFLYFPMCPPHEPVVPAPDFDVQSGARDVVRNDPQYGDWVYQGDAMLGQIMAAQERHKLADNTLLIATSDNGAEHRAYAPLRESKRSIYEGGHRVPFVARWPGKVRPGSVNDHT